MELNNLYETAMQIIDKTASLGMTPEAIENTSVSVLLTERGNIYTGLSGNRFENGMPEKTCSEYEAITSMVMSGENRVMYILSIALSNHQIVMPCEKCIELLLKINNQNIDCGIMNGEDTSVPVHIFMNQSIEKQNNSVNQTAEWSTDAEFWGNDESEDNAEEKSEPVFQNNPLVNGSQNLNNNPHTPNNQFYNNGGYYQQGMPQVMNPPFQMPNNQFYNNGMNNSGMNNAGMMNNSGMNNVGMMNNSGMNNVGMMNNSGMNNAGMMNNNRMNNSGMMNNNGGYYQQGMPQMMNPPSQIPNNQFYNNGMMNNNGGYYQQGMPQMMNGQPYFNANNVVSNNNSYYQGQGNRDYVQSVPDSSDAYNAGSASISADKLKNLKAGSSLYKQKFNDLLKEDDEEEDSDVKDVKSVFETRNMKKAEKELAKANEKVERELAKANKKAEKELTKPNKKGFFNRFK